MHHPSSILSDTSITYYKCEYNFLLFILFKHFLYIIIFPVHTLSYIVISQWIYIHCYISIKFFGQINFIVAFIQHLYA